jgi:hypothetical protein
VRRLVRDVFAAGALAGTLLGCGGAGQDAIGPGPPPALTAAERSAIAAYDGRIQAHCVRVARSLAEPGAAPTPAQQRDAFAAADALGALAARKPTAPLGAGQDLRLFLADVIENLEGSNCDPRMRARLGQALRAIPVQ